MEKKGSYVEEWINELIKKKMYELDLFCYVVII